MRWKARRSRCEEQNHASTNILDSHYSYSVSHSLPRDLCDRALRTGQVQWSRALSEPALMPQQRDQEIPLHTTYLQNLQVDLLTLFWKRKGRLEWKLWNRIQWKEKGTGVPVPTSLDSPKQTQASGDTLEPIITEHACFLHTWQESSDHLKRKYYQNPVHDILSGK